jgi:hypothetical protein
MHEAPQRDALDYLTSGVSGTFAVLGTALIIFGGLLRSIEGRFKVGPQGIEATIRARAEVAAAVITEKRDPEEAQTLVAAMDWATDISSAPHYIGSRRRFGEIERLVLEGQSSTEIAAALGMPQVQVDMAMSRLRNEWFRKGLPPIIAPDDMQELERRIEQKVEDIDRALRGDADEDDDKPPTGPPVAPR